MVRQAPLEFLFYAESHLSAGALADALESLGYDVAPVQPAVRDGWLCISGTTPPLRDSVAAYHAWVEEMGALAKEHGCEFDGFGEPVPDDFADEWFAEDRLAYHALRATLEVAQRRQAALNRGPETEDQALERLAIEASEREYVRWLERHGKLR